MAFSTLFGFGSCHGEGIGVSTKGISGVSVGTSIGVASVGTSISSMGVGRVGTVGTIVVGIGVSSNGDRGDSRGGDNWLSIRYWLNIMHRCDWERDLSGLVCIKNLHESSLCLSDFR